MRIDLVPVGDDPPNSINVIIEVPIGGEPVKYEFDKASGALFVDRILHTPMRYPANYGFVPHTLGDDGDPLDALVIARSPFIPGSVVRVRPVGVLLMEDDKGGDEKLLCVPVDTTFPYYADVGDRDDRHEPGRARPHRPRERGAHDRSREHRPDPRQRPAANGGRDDRRV